MEQELTNIKAELYGVQKQFLDFKNEVNTRVFDHLISSIAKLEERVKTLETARQNQIALNKTFQQKETTPPKPLWNLFRR